MTKLTEIGTHFLQNLTSLRKIENHEEFFVSCLRIGDDFLADSESLEHFDLSNFHSIISIGTRFMANSAVRKLDFSAMMKCTLTRVPNQFLMNCTNLEEIIGLDVVFIQVTDSVGDSFLEGCTSLTEVDVHCLRHITSIGARFLAGCTSLSKLLNFSRINNITSIGNSCFENCSSLKVIDTSGFRKVRRIGVNFANGCSQVEVLDFSSAKAIDSKETSYYGDRNLMGRQNFTRSTNKKLDLLVIPSNWIKHEIVTQEIAKAGQNKNGKETLGFDVVIMN